MQSNSNEQEFLSAFDVSNVSVYLEQGRDLMVTSETTPTLTIAKYAYGYDTVKILIRQHLNSLCKSVGVSPAADTLDEICDDIISGFGDLKVTELMLAMKMIREGKFRSGNDNRATFYGTLSSSVICDCLYRYRIEYRNRVLDDYENKRKMEERLEHDKRVATPEQRLEIISAAILADPKTISLYRSILTSKEMATLEYYAKEREALCLLKKRVEQYIAIPDSERDIAPLVKGVEYINKNFPFSPESIEPISK